MYVFNRGEDEDHMISVFNEGGEMIIASVLYNNYARDYSSNGNPLDEQLSFISDTAFNVTFNGHSKDYAVNKATLYEEPKAEEKKEAEAEDVPSISHTLHGWFIAGNTRHNIYIDHKEKSLVTDDGQYFDTGQESWTIDNITYTSQIYNNNEDIDVYGFVDETESNLSFIIIQPTDKDYQGPIYTISLNTQTWMLYVNKRWLFINGVLNGISIPVENPTELVEINGHSFQFNGTSIQLDGVTINCDIKTIPSKSKMCFIDQFDRVHTFVTDYEKMEVRIGGQSCPIVQPRKQLNRRLMIASRSFTYMGVTYPLPDAMDTTKPIYYYDMGGQGYIVSGYFDDTKPIYILRSDTGPPIIGAYTTTGDFVKVTETANEVISISTLEEGRTVLFDGIEYTVTTATIVPIYVSNSCFVAGTPIMTDQGQVPIDKLNPSLHTIRGNKIVDILRTRLKQDALYRFEKDALYKNVPNQATTMSPNHCVFYNGKMIRAKEFEHFHSVAKIEYTGETLYNVLLETHDKMIVNNLIVETLSPLMYSLITSYSKTVPNRRSFRK